MDRLISASSRWKATVRRVRRVMRALAPYAGPHRALLLKGALATLLIVLCRLAFPWPLRGIVELLFAPPASGGPLRGAPLDPVLLLASSFLLVVFLLGLAEYLQRVAFARFSIRWIHDTRAAALESLFERKNVARHDPGDMIARTVGDTARVKNGLKSVLIYAAQNGTLVAGVCIVMLLLDLPLGLLYLVGSAAAVAVSAYGSTFVGRIARRQRRREGLLASEITLAMEDEDEAGSFRRSNATSARADARVTQYEAQVTWITHVLLGVAACLIVLLGARRVFEDSLSAGSLFTLLAYLLLVHDPTVRLGRQITRLGPVLASAERLADVFEGRVLQRKESAELAPLARRMQVRGVRVGQKLDITIRKGERVAILGEPGSGKTALLELLGGLREPRGGSVTWDQVDLLEASEGSRQREIAVLPQSPTWARQPLWRVLGLTDEGAWAPELDPLAKSSGVARLVASLPRGLQTRLSSFDLTQKRRKSVALLGLSRSPASLWLLDEPFSELTPARAARVLNDLLAAARKRTVVMTTRDPAQLQGFDRVIAMRAGRIRYDGPVGPWLERLAQRSA